MRAKFLILILFIGIATVITVGVLFRSSILGSNKVEAESFGIQPPYIKAVDLRPGDVYEQSIRVLRGNSDVEQKVTARFDNLEIANWFTVTPSETIIIEKGEKYAKFYFEVKVPLDARNGDYKGKLYFAISSSGSGSGVSLALGARADIDINIIDGEDNLLLKNIEPLVSQLANNELAKRLQGRFIIRPEAQGQLHYLHPQKNKLYYLSNPNDFLKLLNEEGRGIGDLLLNKIPLNFNNLAGVDSDSDGLPDLWEDSLGTDANKSDTDNDGFSDLEELNLGFSPLEKNKSLEISQEITESVAGFLLLQVEDRGQVWYVDPKENKRILLTNIDNSLAILEGTALGVSEENYHKLVE